MGGKNLKKTNNKIVFFILVNIFLSIIFTIIFLYHSVGMRDSNGVIDKGNIYPGDSSQYSDIDGDGYCDDPNGNNNDDFFYNQSKLNDMDRDGIEDNADIYDNGNAGIKVYIKSFNGDGKDYTYLNIKIPWDTSDPFFEIEVYCYNETSETWEKTGYKKSKTYWDKSYILDPLYLICDVDEDTTEILVKISAKDYVNIPDFIDKGRLPDYEEPIDICNYIDQDYCSVYFSPKQNTYKQFNECGNDDSDTLRKGSIEYYIEVVGM